MCVCVFESSREFTTSFAKAKKFRFARIERKYSQVVMVHKPVSVSLRTSSKFLPQNKIALSSAYIIISAFCNQSYPTELINIC